MVSIEHPVTAKFNVDAKPFEMYLPSGPPRREPLSSESSDSDYVTTATMFVPANYVNDVMNPNDEGDTLYLDISDQYSDLDTSLCSQELYSDFLPPDDELRDRIVKQVEFYFSDVNLTKDAFLLKHVKRNKEGFVSLKLISSFKKVKSLTKDWRIVAYSLRTSDKLVVNEAGTKVGRRDPLPPYDETTPTRTVIAMNLPMDRPSVESVAELFGKCGEIALIRILRPGAPIPPDIKQFVNKHPGLGSCVCAVIEFTSTDAAQKAVSEMGCKNNDWRSMHVVEMAKGKKTVKTTKKESPKSDGSETKKEETEKKKKRNKKRNAKSDPIKALTDGESTPDMNSPRGRRKANSTCMVDTVYGSSPMTDSPLAQLNGRLLFNPRVSPLASPELKHRQKSASYSEGASSSPTSSNSNSPWVHRRRLAAKENGQSPLATSRRVEITAPGQSGSSTKLLVPEGVIRLPRGPDGTNGFHFDRTRLLRDSLSPISVVG